jgi:hypothetical protein
VHRLEQSRRPGDQNQAVALRETRERLEELAAAVVLVVLLHPFLERLPVLRRRRAMADEDLELRQDVLVDRRRALIDQRDADPARATLPHELLDRADHPRFLAHHVLRHHERGLVDDQHQRRRRVELTLPVVEALCESVMNRRWSPSTRSGGARGSARRVVDDDVGDRRAVAGAERELALRPPSTMTG